MLEEIEKIDPSVMKLLINAFEVADELFQKCDCIVNSFRNRQGCELIRIQIQYRLKTQTKQA